MAGAEGARRTVVRDKVEGKDRCGGVDGQTVQGPISHPKDCFFTVNEERRHRMDLHRGVMISSQFNRVVQAAELRTDFIREQ